MKAKLEKLVAEAVEELFGVSGIQFTIELTDLKYGDYSSNVALVAFKGRRSFEKAIDGDQDTINIKYGVENTTPDQFAESIKEKLKEKNLPEIESISVTGGFINFKLSQKFFTSTISEAGNVETWGHNNLFSGKKILVEHSSPNLFKPFHVGHVMNNCIGESITRLAKYSGAEVTTISFPSDISLGVAKAIFILLEKGGDIHNIETLGDAYVEGTKRYEEDANIQARVKEIADNLYAGNPSPELDLFTTCKAFNISYFEQIVARLGSHFDSYIYESEAGVVGKQLVEEHTPSVFTKSEGAIVYIPKEEEKLHTAVFINSQGNPTYEAKDIGLLDLKFTRYNPDLSVFITDNQQMSHFAVVLAAAEKINSEWKEKSLHRTHGRMSFKGQKISSRLGGVPLAEDILSVVIAETKEKNPDITDLDAERIAIAALKVAILRAMAGKDINFDPDSSLSFEGDSGPYLQYTAVRAGSVLAKAKEVGLAPSVQEDAEVTNLERYIARFPEIVMRATTEWAPHHLVGYLLELAQEFNSWYGNTKIIDPENQATLHRLAITKALQQTLTNGLWLLGISVPEKM